VTTAILIDTHFVLWLRVKPQSLTSGERRVLDSADFRHISVVSLWEIAILLAKGRIPGDEQLLEIPQGSAPDPGNALRCSYEVAGASPRSVRPDADRSGAKRTGASADA
jgi:hypothetical protein